MKLAVRGQAEVIVRRGSQTKSRSVLANSVFSRGTNGLMDRVKGGNYPDDAVPNSMLIVTNSNVIHSETFFTSRARATASDGNSVTATFAVSDLQLNGGSGSTIATVSLHGKRSPSDGFELASTSSINPNPSFADGDLVDINYQIVFTFDGSQLESSFVGRLVDSMVGIDAGSSGYLANNNLPCETNYATVANDAVVVKSTEFYMSGEGGLAEAYTGSAEGINYVGLATGTRPNKVRIYNNHNGNLTSVGTSDLVYDDQPTWSSGHDLKVPFRFKVVPDR